MEQALSWHNFCRGWDTPHPPFTLIPSLHSLELLSVLLLGQTLSPQKPSSSPSPKAFSHLQHWVQATNPADYSLTRLAQSLSPLNSELGNRGNHEGLWHSLSSSCVNREWPENGNEQTQESRKCKALKRNLKGKKGKEETKPQLF